MTLIKSHTYTINLDNVEYIRSSDHINADTRRSWNRFTGQLPSKNDIVRAALVDLRLLNDICLQHKWEPLLEEEEEVSIPKLKK